MNHQHIHIYNIFIHYKSIFMNKHRCLIHRIVCVLVFRYGAIVVLHVLFFSIFLGELEMVTGQKWDEGLGTDKRFHPFRFVITAEMLDKLCQGKYPFDE